MLLLLLLPLLLPLLLLLLLLLLSRLAHLERLIGVVPCVVCCQDFHMLGNCFASAGMDNTVKIWALDTAEVQEAVRQSYLWTPESRVAFHTCFVQFPAFSTAKVHNDYVDSVRWVGNLILSKSTENKVVLWCPDVKRGKVRY